MITSIIASLDFFVNVAELPKKSFRKNTLFNEKKLHLGKPRQSPFKLEKYEELLFQMAIFFMQTSYTNCAATIAAIINGMLKCRNVGTQVSQMWSC